MVATYKQSVAVIHKTTFIQENATAAFLRVAWNLAKAKKLFTDAGRVEALAGECLSNLLSDIKKADSNRLVLRPNRH